MIYRFGDFSLDPERRELRCDGDLIELQPRIFDLICFLVRHRDRVVGKDELLDSLWPGVIVVEGALQRAVSLARAKLRKGGADACIKTYARKGYRFVAEVQEDTDTGPDSTSPQSSTPGAVHAKPSIVVLPFDSPGDNVDQDFFAEGMSEDISTALSRLRSLVVISRASSSGYRDQPRDYRRIGSELDVRYILAGSLRMAGDQLRVTVELIDTPTHSQIWSERFDRRLDNLFDIQDDITGNIVAKIEPEFSQFEKAQARIRSPGSLDAWGAYQRGIWHMHQFTREDTDTALPLFQQATSLDPEFAPAYAGASFCHFSNAYLGFNSEYEKESGKALEMAERGVNADNQSPAAHWALGRAYLLQGKIEIVIEELDISVDLNPNFAQGYYMLGWAWELHGDPGAACQHLDRALALSPRDPLLFAFSSVRSMALMLAGDYDEAVRYAELAIRQPNSHEHTGAIRVAALSLAGQREEAGKAAIEILARRPDYNCRLFERSQPHSNPRDMRLMLRGLLDSGIPE